MTRTSDEQAVDRAGGRAYRKATPSLEPSFSDLFRAWRESHKASFVDSLSRLAAQPTGSFFSCLVMAVALSLPMGLALLLDNLEHLAGSWQKSAQISVFMRMDVSESASLAARDQIAALANVSQADWISPEQGLKEFQQLSGMADVLRELPQNPLPGVIRVVPNQISAPDLEALRTQLSELSGVESAQLDMLWVERLDAILTLGDRFIFGLTLLLVAALLLVIGNTIRLHIENRRSEIEVVKLVGGTDSYVRRPFLYMGTFYGLGAGLLAWVILAYGLDWLNQAVVKLSGLYGSDFSLAGVPLEDAGSLVLGAVLLGYIGAWLAVARHLNELTPK